MGSRNNSSISGFTAKSLFHNSSISLLASALITFSYYMDYFESFLKGLLINYLLL